MTFRAAVLFGLLAGFLLAGCTTPAQRAETQIRERIASIRTAILERRAEGIVEWGTEDWSFTGPEGTRFDKAAYLARTRGLFDRVVAIDSLDTHIDTVAVHGATAEVELTQTMERHEREATSVVLSHLRLRYREHHDWVRTPDGWRVRTVRFIGQPERTVLSTP